MEIFYLIFLNNKYNYKVGSGNTSPDTQALAVRNSRRGSEIKDISLSSQINQGVPTYPKFKKCREKFMRECAEAKKTGEYTKMVHFYGTAFQNFANMNAVFKVCLKATESYPY